MYYSTIMEFSVWSQHNLEDKFEHLSDGMPEAFNNLIRVASKGTSLGKSCQIKA